MNCATDHRQDGCLAIFDVAEEVWHYKLKVTALSFFILLLSLLLLLLYFDVSLDCCHIHQL
jgi:hypothetical protein